MNGLPALAQDLAAYGRNGDTMLVHMTPGEVQGLQALAYTQGGSLSINPDTGLVEANFLKRMLPMIAGAALTIGSGGAINPLTAGMIVGGVEGVRTGDLSKGLMAGLGAYGGAGFGAGLSAAGAQAAGANAAQTITAQPAASYAANNLAGTAGGSIGQNFATAGRGFEALGTEAGRANFMGTAATGSTPATGIGGFGGLAKSTLASAAPFMEQKPATMPTPEDPYAKYEGPYKPTERQVRYPTEEERRRLGTGEFTYFTPSNPIPFADGGAVSPAQAQVMQNIANVQNLAGLPAVNRSLMSFPQAPRNTARAAMVYNPVQSRSSGMPSREQSFGFRPVQVVGMPDTSGLDRGGSLIGGIFGRLGGSELPTPGYTYDVASQSLRPSQAYLDAIAARRQAIANEQAAAAAAAATANNMGGFAYGGSVPMLEEGGFVLTKKAVDGLGGGDNKRGQQVAKKNLGAKPIRGPGTGTSDSIRTSIAGKQPALVSNGEAYVPEKKVKQNGGAKAFYELMARAEKAAKA